ncbi:DUF6155 family protein [Acidaminobacter sp.]|uniref:DUF6155 family protein n=1 Tax=Acidaminobacter sp. TaxID=1872102 RepID=UPI0025676038|nr:DUF6155 family protein [Acidaminobacter sp.]MDK9711134.1 DUF6155 family protein [Acidaminobacter sp.]
MKPITVNELKKELKKLDQAELIELITKLYKDNKTVKEALSGRFIGAEYQLEMLESNKNKIYDIFFPDNPMKPVSYKKAIDLLEVYRSVGNKEFVLDLMLNYVECGAEFTEMLDGPDGKFYSSLIKVYSKFVDLINENGTDELHNKFRERISKLYDALAPKDWGLGDAFFEMSLELEWFDEVVFGEEEEEKNLEC